MTYAEACDVAVVGSGNGGLVAALCLYEMGVRNVRIFEASDKIGGTSALSGGGIWVPGNHYAAAQGVDDDLDEAIAYVLATDPDNAVPDEMVDAYVRNAPHMLRFLHERTRVRYRSLAHYPDYFSDLPGARSGHRSLEPEPVDITRLSDKGRGLRDLHPIMRILGLVPMTQTEGHIFNVQARGWRFLAAKLFGAYVLDIPQRLRGLASRRATCGKAGVARLLWSLEERGLKVECDSPCVALQSDNGRVTGLVVEQDGVKRTITARQGVVLASGGFEHRQALREQYLPAPTNTQWSTTSKANTGAPIEMAQQHGARLAAMDGAWWVPTFRVPGQAHPYPSIMEKSYPGSIVVDKRGKRIANESMNYQMFVRRCHELHADGIDTESLWIVFDSVFRKKYVVSPILTSKLRPDWTLPKSYFTPSFLTKADSIEELSNKLGIDAESLAATVAQFNKFAENGRDEDFGRGDSDYDRYYADPDVKPNPCLAPIRRGPFYAVRIYLGEFGTNGGLEIDTNARVRHENGQPIEGLYATGNCTAAVLPAYPGPGSTLGPAMTFAYQAAKHIFRINYPEHIIQNKGTRDA